MSKILVTGAAGFIGSFILDRFSSSHKVYAVSRRFDTKSNSKVEWIQADLAFIDCQTQLPHDIDCVIHLAQSKEYRHFPSGSVDMRRVNIDATCKLLEWLVRQELSISSLHRPPMCIRHRPNYSLRCILQCQNHFTLHPSCPRSI